MAKSDQPQSISPLPLAMAALLLLLSACGPVLAGDGAAEPLVAAGYVEAEEITLSAQVGGRIVALPFDVGTDVQAGQVLVQIDARIAAAQVAAAEARATEAQARLEMARNGATAPERRSAEAQLAQAGAARAGACKAWENALAILENPQALERQIAVAQAQVRAAQAARDAAAAYKDVAEIGLQQFEDGRQTIADAPEKVMIYQGGIDGLPFDLPEEIRDFLEDNPPPNGTYRIGDLEIIVDGATVTIYKYLHLSMPLEAHFIPNQYWKAWVGLNTAQAAYEGGQSSLGMLYRLRNDPDMIEAEVDAAEAACKRAQAQERMAQTQVDGLEAGLPEAEIAILDAGYRQALAELDAARIRLDRHTLAAPVAGVVLERPLEVGELAAPNAPVVVLADLETVYLTLYLPNVSLGRVRIGQRVTVTVPSAREQTYTGSVSFIGQEAEFPPQNVPQPDERATLIFAVRVRIANPDGTLKPGLLAEAAFSD